MSFSKFLKTAIQALTGTGKKSSNGKFDIQDLITPHALINGIFGKDRTKNITNDKIDAFDVINPTGLINYVYEKNQQDVAKRKEEEEKRLTATVPAHTIDAGTINTTPIPKEIPEPTPEPTPELKPEIPDTTDENVSTTINPSGYITAEEWMKWLEEDRAARWERDDRIQAEVQAREDNAWQRGVRDMQLAGINPNLINATPAASGGGITSSSGIDYSGLMSEQAAKYSADVQSAIEAMNRQFQKETLEIGQKFELLLQEHSYNRQEALEAMKAENEMFMQEYLQTWKKELLEYEIITENEYKIAMQEDSQLHETELKEKERVMSYVLGFAQIIGGIASAFR